MEKILALPQIDYLADVIKAFAIHYGIFAPLLLLIIEEAGIPLPIPGDIMVAYAGYEVKLGNISYWVAFSILLSSVLLGSTILYFLSKRFGRKIILNFGEYIGLDEKRLHTMKDKFKLFGPLVIIFGRHIPGFRIPITIFSGVSEVPYVTFILSTLISVVFWIPIYMSLGSRLGPRTVRLFHGHHWYFLIGAIPLIIFMYTIVHTYIHQRRKKKSKD